MKLITKEGIRSLSSERIFSRGMRYFTEHAVKNVTWNETAEEYHAVVMGQGTYHVSIGFNEDGDILHECNCPTHVRTHEVCKHVVAVLLYISDYQVRHEAMEKLSAEEDKEAWKIIDYFRKREFRIVPETYYRITYHLNVPAILSDKNTNTATVSFYAGVDKFYKINNIKKFIQDYYGGKAIHLGKNFNFLPGECEFDEQSKRVIGYLNEIYEIQTALGKTYYTNLINSLDTVLSKKMLVQLLKDSVGLTIDMNIFGKDFESVEIVSGNPDVAFDISNEEPDSIIVDNKKDQRIVALSSDGSMLYYNNKLYLPDNDFVTSLLPFFSALYSGDVKRLKFSGENKTRFIESVLPQVKKNMIINIPEELTNIYIIEPLKPVIRLDIEEGARHALTAAVSFNYGKYKINPLVDEAFSSKKVLIRDSQEEKRLTRILYELGFTVKDDLFILKNEDAIFELMTSRLSALTDNFEVYFSKNYRNAGIRRAGHINALIRVNTNINLLEMSMAYSTVPDEELKDFFRAIKLKKKYFRLKDGSFVDMTKDRKHVNIIESLLENADSIEGNEIYLRKHDITYLENLSRLTTHIDKDGSYHKLLADLKDPESADYPVPESLKNIMRPYQVTGFKWMKTLAHYEMGGILADDMGLGKTLQSIAYMLSCKEESIAAYKKAKAKEAKKKSPDETLKPHKVKNLVICPTSLAYNWQEEFEKFAPSLKTIIASGTPAEREKAINESGMDVVITTYPLIRKDIGVIKTQEYDNVFIDEAQFIKNQSSLGARAVKSVRARHRFALTGTPVENSLSELWSIFEFIMPGFFPKYSKFSAIYEKPIIKEDDEVRLRDLKAKIRPFVLRRMKKDVLSDLPDKIETRVFAEMTRKQEKIYYAYLSRIRVEIAEHESVSEAGGRIQILAALTRLRQICCHPSTFIENYEGGSGKMDLLMEKLPQMLESGHSVIIFSQFTSMLTIIAEQLDMLDIDYFYLSGATNPADRKRFVRDFNKGYCNVFLISLKAGGTGLNLTGADTVIHFDPWWNPAVEEQATDRAYRIGQKRKVQVIRFITKDSIEEKIDELQYRKKALYSNVIESNEVFLNKLTEEDLKALFF
ncbi:MAG: DEAD/DEAH box helicase [Lachnospiraceae bacterium]|nr:DEAD/DEAH box helicase [Lachnospiraceae bacterium]